MKRFLVILLAAAVVFGMSGVSATASVTPKAPELDNKLVSVMIGGVPYDGTPIPVVTDQVFRFTVTVENTGTATWGQSEGERGSTLFSKYPDYNENFGTFLISPGQSQKTKPGDAFTYLTHLRAPSEQGDYTMKWQAKDWIIPDIYKGVDYADVSRQFFGQEIAVSFAVTQRAEQPPAPAPHIPGVLDASDFEYEGSFTLPFIPPGLTDNDLEKTFFESGVAMREVKGEKRLMIGAGSNQQTLYEIAIPEHLQKIVGNNVSDVPIAPFCGLLGDLPRHENATRNGSMWYDEEKGLLYWTNFHNYWVVSDDPTFPVLRAGRIENGTLVPVGGWCLPAETRSAMAYWGGVTKIPDSFAALYTGGRTLALGFGGSYSSPGKSWGPALSAAAVPALASSGGRMDLKEIFHFAYFDGKSSIRDGNYLIAGDASNLDSLVSPWQGSWTELDEVRTGVFIDLPDKRGYVTFTRLATGRVGYDYGGRNWNGKYENCWYFYDYETLGKTANGEIAYNEIQPSSIKTVEYPYEKTSAKQKVTGSYFDADTRLLYLYVLEGNDFNPKQGMYNDPIVHVYRVTEDPPEPEQPTDPAIDPPTGPGIDIPPGGDGGGGDGDGSGNLDAGGSSIKVAVGADGVPVLSAEPTAASPLNFAQLPASAFKIADKTWTGKRIKYVLSVRLTYRLNGKTVTKTLRFRSDYTTAKPGRNKNIGKGSITVKGLAETKYKGSKALTFKIVPKKPVGLKLLAGKRSLTVKWKKVSRAQRATGYQVQYRCKSGAKWGKWRTKSFRVGYKAKAKTVAKTVKKLKAKKSYQTRIRTYKTIKSGASKGKYYSAWASAKPKKTK